MKCANFLEYGTGMRCQELGGNLAVELVWMGAGPVLLYRNKK